MTTIRAEDRKFHFIYKVTCAYNGRVFYGLQSSDSLDDSFTGSGHSLSISKSEYGQEQHKFEVLEHYPSRAKAKIAYNNLKASQLTNPIYPENRKFHFLYKTTRFDGKYYIGIHSTDDMNDGYRGSGTYIARSLKKHGFEKHSIQILEMCESRDHAFKREETMVTQELLLDSQCMNKIKGGRHHGNRVYGVTDETRCKIGKKSKATFRTPEWKAKISASHKGKTMPREAVEKQRAKMIGHKWTKEQIAARTVGQLSSEKFKRRYRAIVVHGITYANGREAVAALGIPGSTLNYRINTPTWPNYNYADQLTQ